MHGFHHNGSLVLVVLCVLVVLLVLVFLVLVAGIHVHYLSKSSAGRVSLMIQLPGENLGCHHLICGGLTNLTDSKRSEGQPSTNTSFSEIVLSILDSESSKWMRSDQDSGTYHCT